eukprot:Gregarina_sp_Poly_1__2510@NODE_167_length_12139_cov_61_777005_g148_i0_p9_GENE_NODE_167_length_12139_cov_61_777005_g148_i0NODE_167_length_12139_cov_61_777005_g148_i0_p9_ORF_typecomplete_len174_score21_16_NODE_167_length_12139_cov_61_777005_g148_i071727693
MAAFANDLILAEVTSISGTRRTTPSLTKFEGLFCILVFGTSPSENPASVEYFLRLTGGSSISSKSAASALGSGSSSKGTIRIDFESHDLDDDVLGVTALVRTNAPGTNPRGELMLSSECTGSQMSSVNPKRSFQTLDMKVNLGRVSVSNRQNSSRSLLNSPRSLVGIKSMRLS